MGNLRKIKHDRVFHCFPTLSKIFVVFFLFSTIPQNEVNSQIPDPVVKTLVSLEQTSFWSDTLRGLFKLTDTYVDLISKNKFGPSLLKGLGIDVNNLKLSQFDNLQFPGIQQTLNKIAKETAVYITHFVIGIVIFVALIVCTFALCCCRSKACCGNKGKQEKKSYDKTVICVMFILILILTVVIFLDGFGLGVATKVFTDNFEKETGNTKVMNKALTIIRSTVVYVNSLKIEAVGLLDKFQKEQVGAIITKITSTTLEEFMGKDNTLKDNYVELNEGLKKSKTNVDQMSGVLENLKNSYSNVETSLKVIKDKAEKALSGCTSTACLNTDQTFKSSGATRSLITFDEIEKYMNKIDGIIKGDFGKIISQKPDESINGLFKDLGPKLVGSLLDKVKALLSTDLPISNEKVTSNDMFNTVNQLLDKISPILTIVGYIIASLIFIMVVINLVGLLLVIFCGSAKPSIPEKIFVVSGGTYFPIGAIIALLAAILFIATCPLYGEFCRDFSKGEESLYFGIADNAIEENLKEFIAGTKNLEGLDLKLHFSELNFIRSGLYGNCQNNQSLAKVLLRLATIDKNLTNSIVTKLVDPFLDNFFQKNIDLNTKFKIFKDETIQTLKESFNSISSSSLSVFDKITDISGPVIAPPSSMLIIQARNALNQGGDDLTIQQLIDTDIPEIESVAKQILEKEEKLVELIASFKVNLENIKGIMQKFLDDLKILRENLIQNGGISAAIKTSFKTAIRSTVFDIVMGLMATLGNSFFCRPLFDLFSHFISIPCSSLLRPMNAMWLTLGVFPLLVIPSVGFGLFMGRLLVRQKSKALLLTQTKENLF